jgi:hypothetical protein
MTSRCCSVSLSASGLDQLPQGMVWQQVFGRQRLPCDRRGVVGLQPLRNGALVVALAVADAQHRLAHHLLHCRLRV